jgi:hypothetical protein
MVSGGKPWPAPAANQLNMIAISDKKLAANRANGALSRGPKTLEGKVRSARNALKHGLLANITTLRVESQEVFDDHVQAYCDHLQPANNFELGLVEEMAVASWHLRRAFAIETQMLESEMDACTNARSELDRLARVFGDLAATPKLNLLHRYQTRLHNMHSRTLRDLILARKAFPPSETGGQAGDPNSSETPAPPAPTPDPEPAQAPTTSPEPHPSPLPKEPKSPFPINEFLRGEPTNQPGTTCVPDTKVENPVTQVEPYRFPARFSLSPTLPGCASMGLTLANASRVPEVPGTLAKEAGPLPAALH